MTDCPRSCNRVCVELVGVFDRIVGRSSRDWTRNVELPVMRISPQKGLSLKSHHLLNWVDRQRTIALAILGVEMAMFEKHAQVQIHHGHVDLACAC